MTWVLVVEDTRSLQTLYRNLLQRAGLNVKVAASGDEARHAFAEVAPQVVCLDLGLPDCDGLELMQELQRTGRPAQFVVITANGSVERAVELIRHGAREFLVKPFNENLLLTAVRQAVDEAGEAPVQRFAAADGPAPIEDFVGSSPAMRRVNETIGAVSASIAPVFLTGESGTGKQVCARAIHARSPRRSGPFVVLKCGALQADQLDRELLDQMQGRTEIGARRVGSAPLGFTLFLDEVGDTSPEVQARLLHLLQTSTLRPPGTAQGRRIDARPIAATRHDPLAMVREGRLREDLYYRLRVVPIDLPPLRERDDDVIQIAGVMLKRFSEMEGRRFDGLDEETLAIFRSYDWPGNLREMRNVLWNVVLLNEGPLVTPRMLPPELTGESRALGNRLQAREADLLDGMTLAEAERLIIERAIDRAAGSVPRAARALDVAPSTLYRKRAAWLQRRDA